MEVVVKSVSYDNGKLVIIDQTALPNSEVYLEINDLKDAIEAIRLLKVRGAPAIGIFGAYAFVLAIKGLESLESRDEIKNEARKIADELISVRPTAVNLSYAVERVFKVFDGVLSSNGSSSEAIARAEEEAMLIHQEDIQASLDIGENVLRFFERNSGMLRILTHCNTGALATGGLGTALYAIRRLYDEGWVEHVYVSETRPLLQGARLTCWELEKYEIPYSLIVDSASAHFMKAGKINAVIVGADRVAANCDTANKIGTYSHALAAKNHNIPFLVVCPESTLDPATPDGKNIEIEMRSGSEVAYIGGVKITANEEKCINPAFDVTPAEYITAVITEKRIIEPNRKRCL